MFSRIFSHRAPSRLAAAALALGALVSGPALAQCAAGVNAAWGDYYWWAGNTQHQTGSPYGYDWRVRPGIDAPGYMVYGPYDTRFGVGPHRAVYVLQVNDNTSSPKAVIASLKVYTRKGNRILAHRDLSRRDFPTANEWHQFTVHFDNPCFEELETTVYWRGEAQLVFGQVHVVND